MEEMVDEDVAEVAVAVVLDVADVEEMLREWTDFVFGFVQGIRVLLHVIRVFMVYWLGILG